MADDIIKEKSSGHLSNSFGGPAFVLVFYLIFLFFCAKFGFVNVNTTMLSVSTLTTALIEVLLFMDTVARSSLRPLQLENATIHSM